MFGEAPIICHQKTGDKSLRFCVTECGKSYCRAVVVRLFEPVLREFSFLEFFESVRVVRFCFIDFIELVSVTW
jgi:hypothetical protein